ncbi:hypothetical protein [Maribacter sp. 1_2014MBL_MicDiv]|uniref:hypothetical protein n=1 Tax=Maribacter sp. 1_2014MBL_MicDiv TaxID=1644130 RepID=UPI0008F4C2AB|nr:hypothetical protein [Maribacter sp. 1_2014MBL_MicDiv]APA64461.1 hypothetical protein YQ22_09095 [Maribacter sp. 1_2014MBL_MicDiv]
MNKSLICIFLLSITLACSSPDDGNYVEPLKEDTEESIETPTEPSTPETPSGAELLFNGTAIMETNDAKTPYVLFNQNGAIATTIDQDLDGVFEQIILSDGENSTIIEINSETGLPSKMYTSENVLVMYNFKDENTNLDIAIMQVNQETVFIEDIDVSDTSFTNKSILTKKEADCSKLQTPLLSMANGKTWALDSWCKIKEDNHIKFQALNLTAKECNDIYRDMFPCCNLSVLEDAYCTQLSNQSLVLPEITALASCATDGNISDCINSSIMDIQSLISKAETLKSQIGADVILQAEQVLLDVIDENLGGNDELIGVWNFAKYEELSEDDLEIVELNIEYCDDVPNENSCSTITELTLEFKLDGTFVSSLTELDKQQGLEGPADTIVEIESGNWSYDTSTNTLVLVAQSYEYLENGVIVEQNIYPNGEIISIERFTVTNTELTIIFDEEDNNGDGIVEESYTEYYVKD